MNTQKRQFGLPLVLITASVHALYPSMTLGKSQQRYAVVSIKAGGQAFHLGKGNNKPSSAFSSTTLTLYGSVHLGGNGALKLDHLAGSLQIGLSNYTITSGSGEANKKGKIAINAKTTDGGRALQLIGSTDGDAVVFDRKKSRLSSLYVLSLKGQAVVTMPTTSTSSTESDDEEPQATVTVT